MKKILFLSLISFLFACKSSIDKKIELYESAKSNTEYHISKVEYFITNKDLNPSYMDSAELHIDKAKYFVRIADSLRIEINKN